MDITNTSDQDSQYRIAGGERRLMEDLWKPLPRKGGSGKLQLPPWTVEFKIGDEIVSAQIPDPNDHVELAMQPDGKHHVKVTKAKH